MKRSILFWSFVIISVGFIISFFVVCPRPPTDCLYLDAGDECKNEGCKCFQCDSFCFPEKLNATNCPIVRSEMYTAGCHDEERSVCGIFFICYGVFFVVSFLVCCFFVVAKGKPVENISVNKI